MESEAAGASLPRLTVDDVRALADPSSFSRGKSYQRDGMITRTARRGASLEAVSLGSSGGAYRVRITLGTTADNPIADWACTCPRGDFCKHIVALCLSWIADPRAFESRPELAELLAPFDRDALVDLIGRVTAHDPAFLDLIERQIRLSPPIVAAPGPEAPGAISVSPAAIRRALEEVIEEEPYDDADWDVEIDPERSERIRRAFADAATTGLRYEEAGRLTDAVAIWTTVAGVGMERFEETGDHERVAEQIAVSVDGLARALDRQAALPAAEQLGPRMREELLDVLYEYAFFAGCPVGAGDEGEDPPGAWRIARLLGARTTPDEHARLDRRWRADAAQPRAHETARADAIGFGIAFSGPDGLPEDELLELAAAAELWDLQAILLLSMGRPADAIALAARKLRSSHAALAFANELWTSGEDGPARAMRFVDDRLWETEGAQPRDDFAYRDWLASAYEQTGQAEQALALRERLFQAFPGIHTYEALMRVAADPAFESERRAAVRANARGQLARAGRDWELMEILLGEGAVAEALELYKRAQAAAAARGSGARSALFHSGARLARAAEDAHPEEALAIYRSLADEAIGRRNRGAYAEAAEHSIAARRVLTAVGRQAEWEPMIRALREEHRRLPALQDELNQAGL